MMGFSKIYREDLDVVGKKAVELGVLARLGIPIPDGFVITPFLRLSENLIREVHSAYRRLSGVFKETSLNIFTSPLKGKSLQFSNVKGDTNLILKVKEISVSQLHKPVAIIVQKNIKSKIKGKIITNDPLIDKKFTALAYKIQKHFYFPQELNYVIEKNKIYITAISPFTGIVNETLKRILPTRKARKILIKGICVNSGIVTGSVKLINSRNFITVKNSEIIVTKSLSKSLYDKIKKAKAVVADTVLKTSIDKLQYRKIIKAPTIIGAQNATKILQNGNIITVNGMNGEIYSGGLI